MNEAASALGKLASGKRKTMTTAAIEQRKAAAKASAEARRGKKRAV